MAERRLFFCAYSFPPRIAGGTFRVVKFIKYLPEWFDGEIHVITVAGEVGAGDEAMSAEIEGRCVVHRVAPRRDPRYWKWWIRQRKHTAATSWGRLQWSLLALLYRPVYGLYTALKGAVVFPDGKLFWSREAMRTVARMGPGPGDILLTTCPERSLLWAGARFKRKHPEVPWVVDFRDGWYGEPFNFHTRNPLRVVGERRMEQEVFRRADSIICATDLIENAYRARYPEAASKLETLFNGYDPQDFEELDPVPLEPGKLHVVYTGYAGGKRSTYPLLQGLCEVKKQNPESFAKLQIHFVGNFRDDGERWKVSLGDQVRFHGPLPHKEALRYTVAADLLLLLLQPKEGASTAYTGKIFEYARAGAPILALVPPSGASRLVEEHALGYTASGEDAGAIRDLFVLILADAREGNLRRASDEKFLDQFDRRQNARRLAEILNRFGSPEHGTANRTLEGKTKC